MGNVQVAGPDEVLVVTRNGERIMYVSQGWVFRKPSDVQRLSFKIRTVYPRCEDVETSDGVPISVNTVAHCRFFANETLIKFACDLFLGKSDEYIEKAYLQALEDCLKEIIGSLTEKEISQDLSRFTSLYTEKVSPTLGRLGTEITSITVSDVKVNSQLEKPS